MSNSVLDMMLNYGAQSDRGSGRGGVAPHPALMCYVYRAPYFSKCSLFVLISPAALTQNPLSVNV